ncbi:hypothetical protein RB598_004446 [Gaeumannomyces tritici]
MTGSSTPAGLPDINALPTLDDAALFNTLDLLFEKSPDMHALAGPVARTGKFTSYPGLIDAVREALLSLRQQQDDDAAARARLLGILGAHPRLGEKKVDSAQSRAEQANLQHGAGAAEAERLAALNAEYEARFPGLRYVVFVNGRGRDVVMANMRERIDRGDARAEEREAIEAMVSIAKDRAGKLLSAAGTA